MAMVDADPAALLATAAAQPHDPGFVPFVRRAQAAGIPVEVVSDGFGFFIEPALAGARGRGAAGRHGPHDVRGPARVDRLPERPPDVLRVRDLQAQPRPRPPGGRPRGRVHRRRRERPLRRGLQRHRVGQAIARPDLPRGRLAVPALDGVPRDRDLAGRDAWRRGGADPSTLRARRGPPVLLRPRGLGRGPRRSAARRVAADQVRRPNPALRSRPWRREARPDADRPDPLRKARSFRVDRLPRLRRRRPRGGTARSRRSRRCAQPPTIRPSTQIVGPALPALSNSAARCPPRYQSRSFQPIVVASSAGRSAIHGSGASIGSRSSGRT